eukprot:TRINITY_DN833_c0_g1_i1.p1 TRINITY_DN833_c0_g1~~TRINITY_DN833_c0_g1_i1.p1  ORF type:complete len:421 (-),score=99.26 TRINITY_DN833_c0_g1_i1:530-1792(-)
MVPPPPPRGRAPKRYKSHNSTLPSALKERLGQDGSSPGPKYGKGKGKGHSGRKSILNRKEQRKQARIAAKQNKVVHQQRQRKALEAEAREKQREAIKAQWKAQAEAKRAKQGDNGGEDDNDSKKKDKSKPKDDKKKEKAEKKKKRKRSLSLDDAGHQEEDEEYQGPPGPVDPEDELIAMYERKLGRVTKADGLGDGLDDIVAGLPSFAASKSARARSQRQPRPSRARGESDSDSDPFADDDDSGRSSGRISGRSDSTSVHTSSSDDEDSTSSSASDMSVSSSASSQDQGDKTSQAQSLYGKSFGKPADGKTAYVPPALRKKQQQGGGGGGDVVRITRVLQGHINRMALSNIERTIKAVLDLYDNHSRNGMYRYHISPALYKDAPEFIPTLTPQLGHPLRPLDSPQPRSLSPPHRCQSSSQ